ncbi:SCP2 sterol-binding domain-containing protein [Thiomicrorhabdus sp.]|uniref:ubiquinone biosynthesis accessory factor UbiJ n=1 Tax=Thiomicrorhabdus sp. TaxID=2039724 RepID=UPI0029C833A3|nr:SCP2 sterol-binding domain-containing protein [Thiomicrorhabdus sp.]
MATIEMLRSAVNGAIETLVNRLLTMEENADLNLQPLRNKVVSLHIRPLQSPLYLLFGDQSVVLQQHIHGEADAEVQCELQDLLQRDATRLHETCRQSGDSETAEAFLNLLAQIEFDWEEHLSHYTGDLIAFKIGHGIRSLQNGQRKRRQDFEQTLKEYLQFEINLLPTASQIRNWSAKVDETSKRIEALEQRIDARQTATESSPPTGQ